MANGWSVNSDEVAAVKEAAAMVKQTVSNPNFLVVYCTSKYDQDLLRQELAKTFPSAKLYGVNSYQAVFTQWASRGYY